MTFCNDYHFLEGVRIISYVITVLKIVIPILLIVFGTYDFIQTVTNPDKSPMKEKAKSFAFRIVSAFLIFMLPTIIKIVFSISTNFGGTLLVLDDCLKNANKEYIEQLKAITVQKLNEYESGNDIKVAGTYNNERYKKWVSPNKDNGTGSNGSSGGTGSFTNGGDVLQIASSLWQQVVNGSYVYGGTSIPPSGTTIDCSSFVSWIIYEYGYDDFGGYQHITEQFVNTDWNAKYGWEEIPISGGEDVTSKLQPGDILVRDSGNNDGHMNITASVEADGTVLAYDCGSAKNWQNSNGEPVAKNSFAKSDSRPGKIIRITKPS